MSRWLEETGGARGASYDEAFRELAASGVDVHGEAAFVADLVRPRARVLDAGCGTGRVAVELARRGHVVTGVDSDASMLEVARRHADVRWHDADLAALDLPERFDLVVAAGNVVVFLAEGTEQEVLRRLAVHLVPGGLLVSGWRTDRLSAQAYDGLAVGAGLEPVERWSTWDREPWVDDADWCVAVHRRPGAA
jgi:SAM-dependent methyltransferase